MKITRVVYNFAFIHPKNKSIDSQPVYNSHDISDKDVLSIKKMNSKKNTLVRVVFTDNTARVIVNPDWVDLAEE